MEIEVNCIPSDWGVNVQGIDRFTAKNTSYTYELIVNESGVQIVDENGEELVASISPVNTEIGTMLVNCLPSDWEVNTE